jgi:uncharacterized protein (TIGR02996 family)
VSEDSTMTEGDALLRAILDSPEDDAPRLVYADWLEEHGEPARAEFIRLQIELARRPAEEDRRLELAERAEELENQHRTAWLQGTPAGVAVGGFERGFPERMGPPLRDWPHWGLSPEQLHGMAEALERFPIRRFSAYQLLGRAAAEGSRRPTSLELLADWPWLRRLHTISVGYSGYSTSIGDNSPGVRALAGSPHAQGLTALRLSGCNFNGRALRALAESPHCPRLTDLDVSYNEGLGNADLERLARSPLGSRLRCFNGEGCRLSGEALRSLLNAADLRRLDVSADGLGRLGVRPWLGAERLAGLRQLSLSFLGPAVWEDRCAEREEVRRVAGLGDLLGAPALAGLEELALRGLALGDRGVRALARAPLAPHLVALTLERCTLTGACLPALRRLLAEGRLRRLLLSWNFLTTEDARTLAGWPELARLHELDLEFNDVEEPGFETIQESPYRHPRLRLSG